MGVKTFADSVEEELLIHAKRIRAEAAVGVMSLSIKQLFRVWVHAFIYLHKANACIG